MACKTLLRLGDGGLLEIEGAQLAIYVYSQPAVKSLESRCTASILVNECRIAVMISSLSELTAI